MSTRIPTVTVVYTTAHAPISVLASGVHQSGELLIGFVPAWSPNEIKIVSTKQVVQATMAIQKFAPFRCGTEWLW